jgi:hypothetical protein
VWEYNVVQLPYSQRNRAETLNKLSSEGWELVAVTYEANMAVAFLRRSSDEAVQTDDTPSGSE